MNIASFITRFSDWFEIEDVAISPFYLGIVLLSKLNKRKVRGLKYDRLHLIQTLIHRQSVNALSAIDAALVLLISRNLVYIDNKNFLKPTLFITDLGVNVLNRYIKEVKDVY